MIKLIISYFSEFVNVNKLLITFLSYLTNSFNEIKRIAILLLQYPF